MLIDESQIYTKAIGVFRLIGLQNMIDVMLAKGK